MCDIVESNANLRTDEKLFFKFRSDNSYNIDSLKNNYMYFTQPNQFRSQNDDSDFSMNFDKNPTEEELKKYIKHGKNFPDFPYHNTKQVRRALKRINILEFKYENKTFSQVYDELIQRYYVFCLTDTWQSKYLWEAECFGHNYEGFCIGYKATLFELDHYGLSVKYEKPYFHDYAGKCLVTMPKVSYDNDGSHKYNFWGAFSSNPDVQKHNVNTITYNFLHKKPEYAQEREYRAWFYTTSGEDEHKVEYNPDLVSCVIFGMNCSQETIDSLVSELPRSNPNIKFYKQTIEDDTISCTQI